MVHLNHKLHLLALAFLLSLPMTLPKAVWAGGMKTLLCKTSTTDYIDRLYVISVLIELNKRPSQEDERRAKVLGITQSSWSPMVRSILQTIDKAQNYQDLIKEKLENEVTLKIQSEQKRKQATKVQGEILSSQQELEIKRLTTKLDRPRSNFKAWLKRKQHESLAKAIEEQTTSLHQHQADLEEVISQIDQSIISLETLLADVTQSREYHQRLRRKERQLATLQQTLEHYINRWAQEAKEINDYFADKHDQLTATIAQWRQRLRCKPLSKTGEITNSVLYNCAAQLLTQERILNPQKAGSIASCHQLAQRASGAIIQPPGLSPDKGPHDVLECRRDYRLFKGDTKEIATKTPFELPKVLQEKCIF